jgi:parvulin-like peptidyl-prolyl isomerase
VRRLAALILCTFAFAAACGQKSTTSAATVNGSKISTSDLVDELNAIEANPAYIQSLQGTASGQPAGAGGGITVVGATPGSFDAAFVSQVLLREMDYSMIHAEVAKRHLTVNDACRLEASNDAKLNLGQGDATTGDQLFSKFPKRYQDLVIQRNADVLVLQSSLGGQQCGNGVDAQGYYNTHPADFTKLCISLIAVNDQATADSVVAQARGGADFATLAKQVSVDPTTKDVGGDIGCRLPSAFNPTVAALLQAAQTGEVLDPIPGSGGISIVKITDRQLAPFADVQTQAEELATSGANQAFSAWLRQARADAKVTVDPRYGNFDPSTFQITPSTSADANSNAPSSSSSQSSLSSSTDAP